MVQTICLPQSVVRTDAWTEKALGSSLDDRHYVPDFLIKSKAVDVIRPNGSLLLALRPKALLQAEAELAYETLLKTAKPTNHRTLAQGGAEELWSGTLGYLDGEPRGRIDERGWNYILPLFQHLDLVFSEACPAQYAILADAARQTPAECLIPQTVFTSAAVNRWCEDRNARMAVHRDDGNLPGAYGAMTVIRNGDYKGGLLVFPKFRVAVDLHSRDVLICNNQEAHGNTPIIGEEFERISVVAFFHEAIFRKSFRI